VPDSPCIDRGVAAIVPRNATPMPDDRLSILKGALDVLVLKALSWGPMHGYAVSAWIRQITGEAFDVQEGVLYPALHRLERKGWVAAEWGLSENNRRARYYELTPLGRRQLRQELATWSRFADAVAKVVNATRKPDLAPGRQPS
jgi:PadR family transcriptional regulator, regulatory protein PadR